MLDVGVFGASGFGGAELMRLLAGHPSMRVRLATADSQAGGRVADLYPSLAAAYPDNVFAGPDPAAADGLDVVFLALPHGASQGLVPDLRKRVGTVVDLAADFRLEDASLYPEWYGEEHHHPELLAEAVFGIPELFREKLAGATLIAAAGCYVTAAALALAPLVRAGVIEPSGVIVDAASGVSGAGRVPKPNTHFNTVDEDFTAYGLLRHRHTPEMEQATGAQILFTPHLAPMNRGILATCYARPATAAGGDVEEPLETLRRAYQGEPFVVVDERSPSTKATLGSNSAHLTARRDERTGWVLSICALDNLTKGAAGQAIQCANIALDLPETAGLPVVGVYP
ncbi:MAG TPA: N-acetyl-gamma-glutamyl-phosphate reductase [Acidimicrobiales bacterium]|nr:N-acetyl-gamma-glutamyl-phosphate reductase [Acidimicrobiales bacterium]